METEIVKDMDMDWGEKEFRSGKPIVTCNFMCMSLQNPIERFVEKATQYGYSLKNVSTSPVSYLGLSGTQYVMVLEKNL